MAGARMPLTTRMATPFVRSLGRAHDMACPRGPKRAAVTMLDPMAVDEAATAADPAGAPANMTFHFKAKVRTDFFGKRWCCQMALNHRPLHYQGRGHKLEVAAAQAFLAPYSYAARIFHRLRGTVAVNPKLAEGTGQRNDLIAVSA
jgi:hypothetical protein